MEEKLKAEVARLEKEISNKENFIKGHANGFNVAKHQIIDLLSELPQVEANSDSLDTFLRTLTSIITRIQEIKPMFEPKTDK